MSVRLLSLLLTLALTAGCQLTMPPAQLVDVEHYGPPIWQYKAEGIVRRYMRRALYDPWTARYRFGFVHRGYLVDSIVYKMHYGYVLRVHVDAKNRDGEYTGELLYVFLIRDGRIVAKKWPPIYQWPSPPIFMPYTSLILRE